MERIADRSEYLPAETPQSSPEPDRLESFKALHSFEFINRSEQTDLHDDVAEDEEHLEFRLFSTIRPDRAMTEEPSIAKINLRSPSPINAEPGFINPSRSLDYYFADAPSDAERIQLEEAARSGPDIVTYSRIAWPGSAYEWKVLHVPTAKRSRLLSQQTHDQFKKLIGGMQHSKRTRLGKKARLRLRERQATTRERLEANRKSTEANMIAEREKRNRRNREKKIKRRARDRAKKAEAKNDSDAQSVAESSE